MHQSLSEIVEYIEATRAEFDARVNHLSQAQLDFRVAPDAWSLTQLGEHLRLVETGVARLINKVATQAAESSAASGGSNTEKFESSESFLASLDYFPIENRTRRAIAPEQVAPPQDAIAKQDLLSAMKQARVELLNAIKRIGDYDCRQLTFKHPFLGEINMYQWVLFIGKHERRHLAQADEILAAPNFPTH